MTLFIGEGREFCTLAAALDSKVQIGSQQRSVYPPILKAVRAVREGRIGTLQAIQICLPKGGSHIPIYG